MSGFSYKEYDGVGLGQLIQAGEVKAEEVLEEAIKRIEGLNPSLNAVIHTMYEQGKKKIAEGELRGPFAGVPMLLKDITQEMEGEPISSGSKAFQSYRAKQDATFVKQLRKTGVNIIGQTNVPELALMGITEPAHYGPSRNPWNDYYTPGGSSGGSGVAVASGMVPIAGANDGGGSIRIPAAYCGLFGMKPTRGRTPVGPVNGRNWQGASVEHILSRTVRDSATMLQEVMMTEKGAAFSAPSFDGSYVDCLKAKFDKPLRIAFSTQSPIGTQVHEECKKVVEKTMKWLEDRGHHVEEKHAPVDGNKIAKSYITMYFGEVAAALASLEPLLGRKAKVQDVEPTTWLLGLIGRATSAEEFVLSLREWDIAAFAMEDFFETYDFYVTPTTAFPPAKVGELDITSIERMLIKTVSLLNAGKLLKKIGMVDELVEKSLMRTPFTQLANLTGQPAMTVPMGLTKEDLLPCGVQFMASRGREDILFKLASELEQSELWLNVKKNKSFIKDF
ncbi:MAG: amidase [Bacillus sp. (in: Bacteria)]|nr:amidase [Bacillus sp. (in: firmicutes)]